MDEFIGFTDLVLGNGNGGWIEFLCFSHGFPSLGQR